MGGRGGSGFFIENPKKGVSQEREGVGEGPGGCLWGIRGGGRVILMRGQNPLFDESALLAENMTRCQARFQTFSFTTRICRDGHANN